MMENTKPNTNAIVFKWTIIYVITSIVITYAFQFLNIDQSSAARYITYVPFIIYLFLAQKEYKDQAGGYLTFGQGFVTGLLYSVYSGILLAIFIYIYFKFLSPQIWDQALTAAQDKMTSAGTMSSEQVDTAMQMTRSYGILFAVIGTVFAFSFFGTIISLITAAIIKQDPPPFIPADDVEA
jgi:hypothetical protein